MESGRRIDPEHARVDGDEARVAEAIGEPVGGDEFCWEIEDRHADTLVAAGRAPGAWRNRP